MIARVPIADAFVRNVNGPVASWGEEHGISSPPRRRGALQVVEGANGIDNLLHMQIRVDWDKQDYEGVLQSTIKKYNAMIHTQSAVHCSTPLRSFRSKRT